MFEKNPPTIRSGPDTARASTFDPVTVAVHVPSDAPDPVADTLASRAGGAPFTLEKKPPMKTDVPDAASARTGPLAVGAQSGSTAPVPVAETLARRVRVAAPIACVPRKAPATKRESPESASARTLDLAPGFQS